MQIGEEYGVGFLFIFKHKFEVKFFHASLFANFLNIFYPSDDFQFMESKLSYLNQFFMNYCH
jgi:hypothetical protein